MGSDRDDEKAISIYSVTVNLGSFEFEMLKELSEKCGQDFDKTIRWCIAIAYGMSVR